MAIPIGTTSRQLAFLARWMLVGLNVLAPIVWWRPGFENWGALLGGLLGVWMMWILWRTCACDRTAPSHPFYAALLGVAGVLFYHLHQLDWRWDPGTVGGSMDVSMLIHLILLGLAVMLTQSLLSEPPAQEAVLAVGALAMMAGPVLAIEATGASNLRTELTMLGLAGTCAYLSALARLLGRLGSSWTVSDKWLLAVAWVLPALVTAAALISSGPRDARVALAAGFEAAMLVLLVRGKLRARLIGAAGLLCALAFWGWVRMEAARTADAGLVGKGEQALTVIWAGQGEGGVSQFAFAVGWGGLLWFLVVSGASMMWLLVRGRRQGVTAGTILFCAAAAMVLGAFMSRGGPFTPAVLLAMALIWGLLPTMVGATRAAEGSPHRGRGGLIILLVMVGLLTVLGLATEDHLVLWATMSFGGNDKFLHVCTGILLTMVLTWVFGVRRIRLGMLMIVVSILVGATAEGAQHFFSLRGAEWGDFFAHSAGSLFAGVLYLLCMLSRWCESPDATTPA